MRHATLAVCFIIGGFVAVAATPRYGDMVLSKEYLTKRSPSRACDPEGVWSGTKEDLVAIAKYAEKLYGFENTKNLGRNATMLVPATKQEMERVIAHSGLWEETLWSVYHQDKLKWDNTKYINTRTGSEAVYNDSTGRIVMDERMGTKNYGKLGAWSSVFGEHKQLDMTPHGETAVKSDKLSRDGNQYKYVGILFEHDPIDQNVYYIVDGQTGCRMTSREVLELPTTMSNMWKDMGLACVKNDRDDMVAPRKDGQSALHSLDLDDAKGDWCKCANPDCVADMDVRNGYVQFSCSKCGKVNVKYAKMALELEQATIAAGGTSTWYGPDSEARAHKAASEKLVQ